MSSRSVQISYLLNIAIDINKKIGGTKAYQAQRKAKDKFSVLKDQISKKIYLIRNAMQRKPLSNKQIWTLQDDQQIKQKLRQVNSCLIRIRQSVQQQKSNQNAKQLKLQIIQKLQQQYKSYQILVHGIQDDNDSQRKSFNNKNKYQTLTQMRSQLLYDQNDNTIYNSNKQKRNINDNATQIQLEKIKQWKLKQQTIDGNVDLIIQKTLTLKSGITQAGKLVNQIDAKVKQLTTNVQNLTGDLAKSNKKLKGIVQKFRRPHKFCLDVILVIIFIGLVVGIIKVSNSN